MRLNDQRLIVASVAGLRSTRSAGRIVNMVAGARVKLAENDTPFPLSVNVQGTTGVPTSFSPVSDVFLGSTGMIRSVQVSGRVKTFILPPYVELWAMSAAAETFRITETRV